MFLLGRRLRCNHNWRARRDNLARCAVDPFTEVRALHWRRPKPLCIAIQCPPKIIKRAAEVCGITVALLGAACRSAPDHLL